MPTASRASLIAILVCVKATGVICGLGAAGYEYALLDAILKFK